MAGPLAGETDYDMVYRVAPQIGDALRWRGVSDKLRNEGSPATNGVIQRCIGLAASSCHFEGGLALGADRGAIDQRVVRLQSDGSHFRCCR